MIKLYYSAAQDKLFGHNVFLDVDGVWKKYTQMVFRGRTNYPDAELMYMGKKYPQIHNPAYKISTYEDEKGFTWDIVALKNKILEMERRRVQTITFIPELEIKKEMGIILSKIDTALQGKKKKQFGKLSKQYAILKQML